MITNMLQNVKKYGMYTLLLGGALLTSCSDDDEAPEPENVVEVFTDVTLIFTNTADPSDVVTARAKDPDGEGVQELEVLDQITLKSEATYTLHYEILNALNPDDPEDVGAEIKAEDDEHQFFFSFSSNAFTDPVGDGNIDGNTTGTEAINYIDNDNNGDPVGLFTFWTTSSDLLTNGEFRVRLQHQPDVKTSTSGVNDGETDFDLPFVLNIE